MKYSTLVHFATALGLCETGRYDEALEIADSWPESTERDFIRGAAFAFNHAEEAKDLLSKSARLLTGENAIKASIWLACAYWASGESAEAIATLESVKPDTIDTEFTWGLMRSICEADHSRALEFLTAVQDLLPLIENSLWKGKFFNQRGWLYRRLGEQDRAFIDYEEAKFWCEMAGDVRSASVAAGNVAAIHRDAGNFQEAHRVIDTSIDFLAHFSNDSYLASAHEEKARIYLAEQNYEQAGESAPKAVELFQHNQHKRLLAQSLLTQAAALRSVEAFTKVERAEQLAEYLGDTELMFEAAQVRKTCADAIARDAFRNLVQRGIDSTEGLRAAAKKIGIGSHSTLLRIMDDLGVKRSKNKPRTSIFRK